MTIAELERKLTTLKEENRLRTEAQKEIQRKRAAAQKEIDVLSTQLEKQKAKLPKPLIITDHALLRYAERVHGFDVEATKKKILTPELQKQADVLGAGQFPVNGITAVVRDGRIVTVLKNIKSCDQ